MYACNHRTCAHRVTHRRPRHANGHGSACGIPHEFTPEYRQSLTPPHDAHGFHPDSGRTIASSAAHSALECQRRRTSWRAYARGDAGCAGLGR